MQIRKLFYALYLGLIKRKKCNIEWYLNIDPAAKLKASYAEDLETYMDIADHIQNTFWKITNDGENLSDEDIQYFESLPDIDYSLC